MLHAEASAQDTLAPQRSMLTELPDLAPLQAAARYLPATGAAERSGAVVRLVWSIRTAG